MKLSHFNLKSKNLVGFSRFLVGTPQNPRGNLCNGINKLQSFLVGSKITHEEVKMLIFTLFNSIILLFLVGFYRRILYIRDYLPTLENQKVGRYILYRGGVPGNPRGIWQKCAYLTDLKGLFFLVGRKTTHEENLYLIDFIRLISSWVFGIPTRNPRGTHEEPKKKLYLEYLVALLTKQKDTEVPFFICVFQPLTLNNKGV